MNSDAFKDRLLIAMEGASKRAFAEKCRISEGALRSYLKGETTPDLNTLQNIAQVSGYSLGWLASGEDPRKRGENSNLQINGDKNVQVNGSVVHAVIANKGEEAYAPACTLDPLDAAYLDDWHKLSDVGRMRVWTLVKEEIEKERGEKGGI